jgi:hypothetical protein
MQVFTGIRARREADLRNRETNRFTLGDCLAITIGVDVAGPGRPSVAKGIP